MRNKLIKLLGGYTKDDVLTEAVKDLYNTIGEDDILREGHRGKWYYRNKELTQAQTQLLTAEASNFIKTQTWQILKTDIQDLSNEKMFRKSRNWEDMVAGKIWLFTLDSFETRLKRMSEGTGMLRK